jgi:hypothetical protein
MSEAFKGSDPSADPPVWIGQMDQRTYDIMASASQYETQQSVYRPQTVNGQNPFINYSIRNATVEGLNDDIAYLNANWPGNQFAVDGAWDMSTGLQVGLTRDEETGEIIGAPDHPLNPDTYQIMPAYTDEEGNIIGEPQDNSELIDVFLYGSRGGIGAQRPREFFDNAVFVAQPTATQGNPAILRVRGIWEPGSRVRVTLNITNGGSSSVTISRRFINRQTLEQVITKLRSKLNDSALISVIRQGNEVHIEPIAAAHTIEFSTQVSFI